MSTTHPAYDSTRWSLAQFSRVAEALRGSKNSAIAELFNAADVIEADYPNWHVFVSDAGRWWAVATDTTAHGSGTTLDADTPTQLRTEIARWYAAAISAPTHPSPKPIGA